MKQIAQVLLFDRGGRLLVYLRDDKPDIPFPNHWDFFGGHLEEGESPKQALVREVKEEIGVELRQWNFFRLYNCTRGDVYPNIKYIYWARIDKLPVELTLNEGQRLISIERDEINRTQFANILGQILEDFIDSGLWPEMADPS
ncbi:MAG: NUDIX domain-containing protein [Candidatus Binatia bacterium]